MKPKSTLSCLKRLTTTEWESIVVQGDIRVCVTRGANNPFSITGPQSWKFYVNEERFQDLDCNELTG